jgi:toxin ParE1/3/4
MAQVIWTKAAMRHLREIDDFLSERSPDAASRLVERLVRAPRLLETTPLLGRQVPELNHEDIRELVTVKPYRIIYVVKEDICRIVAVSMAGVILYA